MIECILVKLYKKETALKEVNASLCSLISSSSSDLVRKIPKSIVEHEANESDKDVAWLLRSIRSTCHLIDETKHPYAMFLENRKHFYDRKQDQYQEILDHVEELQDSHRTYEAGANPVGLYVTTGLKDAITKFHE